MIRTSLPQPHEQRKIDALLLKLAKMKTDQPKIPNRESKPKSEEL